MISKQTFTRNELMQKRMEAYIADAIARGKLPGGEILVSHKGKVVCSVQNTANFKGKKNRDKSSPWIYRQYSMFAKFQYPLVTTC